MIDIYDFIKELRLKHIFTSKQLRFIEHIGLYIDDLTIYKIVIVANPLTLKRSSKYGLPYQYNIHRDDFEHVKIKEPTEGVSKGRYILMYVPHNNDLTVCLGEDSETEQMSRLISKQK